MRTTIVAVTIWALATSSLATACSGGSKSNAPPTTTNTATTNAPSTSVATSYTKADLDVVLLTLADMPAGYTPNTEAGPDYPVMSSCMDEAIALEGYSSDAQAKTGTAFSNTSGRLVIQSLTLLPSDVENYTLAALKAAVARCTTWKVDTNTYTMTKADFGPYGEETLSYRVTVKSEVPFVLDVVFLRQANLLVGVMVVGTANTTPKHAKVIFDTAVRKLPKQ
ncbi:MAG TPA: hypothetical protein VFC19_27300 [Candidatus Limnocylindrales bacterium]|nr:hypothetical protein [Candidatus Limnocylindrales bacterium]